MISKEVFINTINYLKDIDNFHNKLYEVFNNSEVFHLDGIMYADNNVIVELLNDVFNLRSYDYIGSDLEYWLHEKDFGDTYKIGDITNNFLEEGHKYYMPDIKKVEDLYEYLVFLSEHDEEINKFNKK